MTIKIIIKRRVPDDKVQELSPLLIQLRALALEQPAYVSGETLKRIDQPNELLVLSSWSSLEGWKAWMNHKSRKIIQDKIDMLLGEETNYNIYTNI
jgi:heme oxygenase (mycobilin-producing)